MKNHKKACKVTAIIVVIIVCLPIVVVLLILLLLVLLDYCTRPQTISLDEAQYPNTESLIQLSGLKCIPQLSLYSAINYTVDDNLYSQFFYHYTDSIISQSNKNAILKEAKNSKRPFCWKNESNLWAASSNDFATYTDFNTNDSILYEIVFSDSLVCLRLKYHSIYEGYRQQFTAMLDTNHIHDYSFTIIDACYINWFPDGSEKWLLQLKESPTRLRKALLDAGYQKTIENGHNTYRLNIDGNADYIEVIIDNSNSRNIIVYFCAS